jgi:hypothetical protein
MSNRFIDQATSGRWLLTVMAGVAFGCFCLSICVVIISYRASFKPEAIVGLFGTLMLVIQGCYKDYFHRDRDSTPVVPDPVVEESIEQPVGQEVVPDDSDNQL